MMVNMRGISLLFCLFVPASLAPAQSLTAADAIHRIQMRYAAPGITDTVDTVKAGDPATPVTGIATTFLDTMDVLREAARRGDNLVITHEPTFYNHRDDTAFFKDDPVYREKLAFIEAHHMVVFRLHDEIHAVAPDHIEIGLIEALGWQSYVKPDDPFFATLPPIKLSALVEQLRSKLGAKTMRVVGDPDLVVSHIALIPGAAGMQAQVKTLRRDDVEVLIAGEASEWETVEYARDAAAQGRHKALILLGHEVSEEPGMEQCAKDLREVFPGVRVDHIVAGQPMWNAEHPPAK
jgi:putative NIF3 family GTP cyclohydrolase 1 type 2